MNHITSLTTVTKIRRCMEALPSNYEEAYRNTLERILKQEPARVELALKTLTWVCHSKRPLKMTELQHALAIEDGIKSISSEDLESTKTILSASLGLVVLSTTDGTVAMIHPSAKSTLRGNQNFLKREPDLAVAQDCLTYMSLSEMTKGPCDSLSNLESRLKSLPLLGYTTRFYGYHVKDVEGPCLSRLLLFLKHEKLRAASWQILHFIVSPDHALAARLFDSIPSQASAFHAVAYWDFSEALTSLIQGRDRQIEVNNHDSHGWTPLHWAASMGHCSLIQTLLGCGALIDPVDSTLWTPLFWAVVKGHDMAVRELLRRNANRYHLDSHGMNPMHWAINTRQHAIIELLLEESLDNADMPKSMRSCNSTTSVRPAREFSVVEAKSALNISKSVYQLAAETSDTEAFMALIQADSKYNSPELRGNKEARSGYFATESLFQNLWRSRKGDYVFWRTERSPFSALGKKILQHSIQTGNLDVTNTLLDLRETLNIDINEDDVSEFGQNGRNYLHLAASGRHPAILTALISKGADVSKRDRYGATPLHYACQLGSPEVVKQLLAAGELNIDAPDEDRKTPLMYFLASGGWRTATDPRQNLEICRGLLGRGASINHRDNFGNTPIHCTMQTWDPMLIKLLLESGADINVANTRNETPVYKLAAAKTKVRRSFYRSRELRYTSRALTDDFREHTIPQQFIDATIDLVLESSEVTNLDKLSSSERQRFSSPFMLALDSHHWRLAHRLRELGAKFRATNYLSSLLLSAAKAGVPEFVKLLIENGAEVGKPEYSPFDGPRETLLLYTIRQVADASTPVTRSELSNREEEFRTGDFISVIQILVQAGDDIHYSRHGENALHVGARLGVGREIIQTLLEAGADPYLLNGDGLDSFELALISGDDEGMSYLLNYAKRYPRTSHWLHILADTNLPQTATVTQQFVQALAETSSVDKKDRNGHTILFHAAGAGNRDLVEAVLRKNANVNAADYYGWTALHEAVWKNSAEVVEILLKAGAEVNKTVTKLGPESWERGENITALHISLEKQINSRYLRPEQPSAAVVQLLLNHGADLNISMTLCNTGVQTTTPIRLLLNAVIFWHDPDMMDWVSKVLDIVQLLVDRGADVSGIAELVELKYVLQFEGHEALWEILRKA